MTRVVDNLKHIQDHINAACRRSGRHPQDVALIGVTKYATVERAQEAVDAGVVNIGENRLEGFLDKYNHIHNDINWHFIGTLQSRKVREVIDKTSFIHSLDRQSLASEINKRATSPVNCFVQVNVSKEATKHGIMPENTKTFVQDLANYDNIRVVGLMTMAPHDADEQALRTHFRQLADLQTSIKAEQWSHAPCDYLSMGMSNDYHIAIEEGATHIRIGTDLIG